MGQKERAIANLRKPVGPKDMAEVLEKALNDRGVKKSETKAEMIVISCDSSMFSEHGHRLCGENLY